MKKVLLLMILMAGLMVKAHAQSASSMKWADICNGKMSATWYGSDEAQQIADKLLSAQKNTGGWMKNIEFHKENDTGGKSQHSCLDNGATTQEMRFLAKVWQRSKADKYQEAFLKALNMIFAAEKSVGGWSQYWPLSENGSYQNYITFNDDLMTNVMKILKDINANKGDFADIVDETSRAKCQASFDKAIECIIKCQVDDNGTPAAWCAQHDPEDFLPMEGRPHELPSISGYESASLLSYLMTIENPSKELQQTIHTAIAWLDAHKIDGKAVEDFTNASGEADRRIVDKAGSAVWGRFIQLGGETGKANYKKFFDKLYNRGKSRSHVQNGKTYTYTEYELANKSYNPEKAYQPIFAIYDDNLQHLYYRFLYSYEDAPDAIDWKGCTVPTSLNALRRTKYQFMGSWPLNVIKNEYPAWKQRIESQGGEDYTTFVLSAETNTGSNTSAEYQFDNNISITNSKSKSYGTGKTNTVKYSAGVQYTVNLPAGMKISKVQFYGYDNYADTDAYIQELDGTKFDATTYVFPQKVGDEMTYASHTLNSAAPMEGSFTFTVAGKQCCLVITLYQSNGTTSITLPVSSQQNAPLYNLQGMQVKDSARQGPANRPSKGIYIQNGKKYFVK